MPEWLSQWPSMELVSSLMSTMSPCNQKAAQANVSNCEFGKTYASAYFHFLGLAGARLVTRNSSFKTTFAGKPRSNRLADNLMQRQPIAINYKLFRLSSPPPHPPETVR
jgi:hypothetical protein